MSTRKLRPLLGLMLLTPLLMSASSADDREPTVAEFRTMLQNGTPWTPAVLELFHTYPNGILDAARAELRWKGEKVAINNALGVAEVGGDEDRMLAIPFLRDERKFVRDRAMIAVEKLPNYIARPLLEPCLYDPENMIRERALKYFCDMNRAQWAQVLWRFTQVAGDVEEFSPQVDAAYKALNRKRPATAESRP